MIHRRATILFCIYFIAVLAVCFINSPALPEMPRIWLGIPADKVVHFLMFFPFTILSFIAFRKDMQGKGQDFLTLSLLLLLGTVTAVCTELVQSSLGYRSGDINDFLADLIGLFFGCAACCIWVTLRKSSHPDSTTKEKA